MTILRELASDVRAAERTLRRALDAGAIRGERLSAKRVRVGAAEQEWVRRRWPMVAELRAALRTQKDVRLAVLFGSMARMDGVRGSDVDVLVELRDPDPARLAALEELLSLATDRRVQLVRVADARRLPPLFVTAARDGRVLTDRDRLWPSLLAEAQRTEDELEDPDNYLVELVVDGLQLAGLRDPGEALNGPRDLRRLREAGVLAPGNAERLVDLVRIRARMVHEYAELDPDDVHRAVEILIAELPGFERAYIAWVKAGFPASFSG